MNKTILVGSGNYTAEIQFKDVTYNYSSGNGVSEYYIFLQRTPTNDLISGFKNYISRIHTIRKQKSGVVIIIQGGYDEGRIELMKSVLHNYGYAYTPHKYGSEMSPFHFSREAPENVSVSEVEIEFTSATYDDLDLDYEIFQLETFVAESVKRNVKDELERLIVHVLGMQTTESVSFIVAKTPDGYAVGEYYDDVFYAADPTEGNIDDVSREIVAQSMHLE